MALYPANKVREPGCLSGTMASPATTNGANKVEQSEHLRVFWFVIHCFDKVMYSVAVIFSITGLCKSFRLNASACCPEKFGGNVRCVAFLFSWVFSNNAMRSFSFSSHER